MGYKSVTNKYMLCTVKN